MKLNKKAILLVLLIVSVVLIAAGCAAVKDPYRDNDAEGYNISIKYDANGGVFTTNTSVLVDSYKFEDLPKDSNGNAQIALLPPDDPSRWGGNEDHKVANNGYFLAGWYVQRNGEGEDVTYGDRWDFENRTLTIEADGTYSASEPVLTLYAAWIPLFEIEVFDLNSQESVDTITFSPYDMDYIQLPDWDEKGKMFMGAFHERKGYTWGDVYLDAEGTQKVERTELTHTGVINYENATADKAKMKLYVDYMEGEWFRITSAKQLIDNAQLSGNYILEADLDFENKIWPTTFMHGNFTGTIVGNGHKISNVAIVQTNASRENTGLFGQLTEKASISNVTFENTTLTIQGGARKSGTNFGLLAGTVSNEASITNFAISGKVEIAAEAPKFMTDDYVIGLVCGAGEPEIDDSNISYEVTGEGITATIENGKIVITNESI